MVHFFDSHIAQKYGVNAAVLAGFLWDCAEEKSTQSPQLHEGRVWVRCSVQSIKKSPQTPINQGFTSC